MSRTKRGPAQGSWDCLLFGWRQIALLLPFALFVGCPQRSGCGIENSVVELTPASFHREVMEADQPVLVEFWAPWCQPCLEMQPAIRQIAHEQRGRVKVCRLNIDDAPDVAAAYGVTSPPLVILFRDGKVQKRRTGKQTVRMLEELISESLKDADRD